VSRRERSCTEASECRSCKALILWVRWAQSGKAMPVDAGPGVTVKHNVVLTHSPSKNQLVAEQFSPSKHEGRRRFISHFATCTHAAQHRRGK